MLHGEKVPILRARMGGQWVLDGSSVGTAWSSLPSWKQLFVLFSSALTSTHQLS
jgi:hypothetical protein